MSTSPGAGDKAAARAEAQRGRILDAAQATFIENGFHAATMATIARRAGMSAGLIYRYFENKDAIVLAIIGRELQRRRASIAAKADKKDIAEGFIETFRQLRTDSPIGASAVLFLEMTAEGTRVPRVAQALEAADQATRAELEAWLARSRAMGADRARDASLLVQIIFEGLAVRAAREPGLDLDSLRRALGPVVSQLK
jgi:AcrR family transcriptional regulator